MTAESAGATSPTEIPPPDPAVARELALEEHRAAWDRARERPDATADLMLAYARRDMQLRGLDPGEPEPAAGPRLSEDPDEAEAGLTAPDLAAPGALEEQFTLRDVPFSEAARRFEADIRPMLPAFLVGPGALVMMDGDGWAAEAREAKAQGEPWTPERARAVLRERWGSAFDDNLDAFEAIWDQLPVHWQQYIDDAGVRDHPEFIAAVATRLGEPFLASAAGRAWLTTPAGIASRRATVAAWQEARQAT